MKNRIHRISQTLYFAVIALLGVFYMLANFWKVYSGWWGIVMLGAALAAIVLTILGKSRPLRVFDGVFVAAQLPALVCWVKFPYIEFGIFGYYLSIGWVGFAVHLLMVCWGAYLFFARRNDF